MLVSSSDNSPTHMLGSSTKHGYFQAPAVKLTSPNEERPPMPLSLDNTRLLAYNDLLKLSPQLLSFKSPVSPTSKHPFKLVPPLARGIVPSADDLSNAIVFDLRPFNVYLTSRVTNAVNLCIPSTLLKRPNYDLAQAIKSTNIDPSDKHRLVEQIRHPAPSKISVVLYDSDSRGSQVSFALYQTLLKFHKYEAAFDIAYIEGGFNSVDPALVEHDVSSPPSATFTSSPGSVSPATPTRPQEAPFLSGFTLPTSTPSNHKLLSSIKRNLYPKLDLSAISTLSDPTLKGYTHTFRIPENVQVALLPKWLRFLAENAHDPGHNAQVLHTLNTKFSRIEQSEQLRLSAAISDQSTHHHLSVCSPSSLCPGCDDITYKIPKGIEYGYKNRYNNVWPYEHSRVKLILSPSVTHKGQLDESDDYFNANYIKCPELSTNQYIATQNPLQATFEDFWKIIWYNKVPVIVCLNNQLSLTSPLGRYFDDQTFNVSGISIRTLELAEGPAYNTRKIEVKNKHYPPLIVHHYEYKDWPDFGTPSSFDSILLLIASKNDLIAKNNLAPNILVHCSAGCGRTGCFITLDMILDTLRHRDKEGLDPWGSDDLVYKLVQFQRKQRILMVQNLDQFLVCYEIILYALANKLI